MKLFKDEIKVFCNGNYIDLIDEKELIRNFHYKKTIDLWGKNNHKKNKTKHVAENSHIEKVLTNFPIEQTINNYLEIGCGEGIDINYIKNNYKKVKKNELFAWQKMFSMVL